nr:PPE family domain protein [Mycobacterium pseudoshottsii]
MMSALAKCGRKFERNSNLPFWYRVHPRAPALLISRLVSWVDDLWCRAIGAGV